MDEHDIEMLTRMGHAVSNLITQCGAGAKWARWIPEELDRMVARAHAETPSEQQ